MRTKLGPHVIDTVPTTFIAEKILLSWAALWLWVYSLAHNDGSISIERFTQIIVALQRTKYWSTLIWLKLAVCWKRSFSMSMEKLLSWTLSVVSWWVESSGWGQVWGQWAESPSSYNPSDPGTAECTTVPGSTQRLLRNEANDMIPPMVRCFSW